jgi:hypothetical protein
MKLGWLREGGLRQRGVKITYKYLGEIESIGLFFTSMMMLKMAASLINWWPGMSRKKRPESFLNLLRPPQIEYICQNYLCLHEASNG